MRQTFHINTLDWETSKEIIEEDYPHVHRAVRKSGRALVIVAKLSLRVVFLEKMSMSIENYADLIIRGERKKFVMKHPRRIPSWAK